MWSNVVPREGSPVYPFRSALQCLDDCCGSFLDCYTEFVCLPFQLRRKLCGKQELLALPPQSNFTTEEGHQPHVDGGVSRWPVVRNARVRSGPHLSSQEIGMLKPGDYVQILEEVTRDGHQRIRIREGASSFFGDDAWVSRLTDKGTVLVEAPPGGVAAAAAAPAVQQLSDEPREVPGAEESPEVARKSMIYIQDMRSCYLLNAALCGCIFLLAWVVLLLVWAKQNQWRMTPVGSILPATRGMTTYGQRELGEFREPQTISVTHKNFNGQGSDNTVIYCTSGLGLPNADWPCESTNNMYNDASRFRMVTNGAYACIFCTEGLYCSEYIPRSLCMHGNLPKCVSITNVCNKCQLALYRAIACMAGDIVEQHYQIDAAAPTIYPNETQGPVRRPSGRVHAHSHGDRVSVSVSCLMYVLTNAGLSTGW